MHNHQQVGSFEHVFQKVFSLLEKHPFIKTSLHYSGPLLEWFESEQPEFLERLKTLIEAGIEKTYQGSSLLAHWKMTLHEKQEQRASVKLYLQEFPGRAALSS
jgi:hypothetical protein